MDTTGILNGVVNGIGSVATTVLQNQYNEREAEKQREWNESMAEKQNAWNYEMWMKEQEYNTPQNQLTRLRDAGLNPLYYGLDGNSTGQAQPAAQPLGYDRSKMSNTPNPIASGFDAAVKAAQISSLELDNKLKEKELGWYDKEHQQKFDFTELSMDEIRQSIVESKSRVENNQMDTKLKAKDIRKKDAEIALDAARLAAQNIDNEFKKQLNPLIARAQDLENQLLDIRNQYEAERILAELAETRAHTAALYAQAALSGVQKEGQQYQNKMLEETAKFAAPMAQRKANLLKWTSQEQQFKTAYWSKTWEGKASVDNYYSEHYEEAFRNSWSKSGVEYGVSEQLAEGIGNAALLGLMLAL